MSQSPARQLDRMKPALRTGCVILVALLSLSWLGAARAAAPPMAAKQAGTEIRPLAGGGELIFEVPAGAGFAEIQNLGIDTEAAAVDGAGHVIARAGSWRGKEGRYLLALQGADRVVVRASQAHVKDGKVGIGWLALDPASPDLASPDLASPDLAAGLALLAQGYRLHLAAYQGQGGAREAAIESYRQAALLLRGGPARNWLADIQFELGQAERLAGELAGAYQSFERALAGYQSLGDRDGQAAALNGLGRVARLQGKRELALQHYRDGLALREALGQSFYQASLLNNIGLLEHERDNYHAALDAYRQALPLQAGLPELDVDGILALDATAIGRDGSLDEIANTLNNLATVQASVGDNARATELWQAALKFGAELRHPANQAMTRFNLARHLLETGVLDQALDLLDTVAATFADLQDDYWYGQTLEWIANVYSAVGELDTAEEYLLRALVMSGEYQQQHANVLSRLGRIDYLQGELERAARQYAKAYTSFAASEQPVSAAVVASEQALVDAESSAAAEALAGQREALAVLETLGQPREAARARSRLGQQLLAMGRPQDAARELSAALQGHRTVGDQLFELDTLLALSRARDGQAALEVIREAATLAMSIRLGTHSPQLQASFLASRRAVFGRYIDLLVAAGRPADAWAVNEQSRARGLLDLIEQDQRTLAGANHTWENRTKLLEQLAAAGDSLERQQLRRRLDVLDGRLRGNAETGELEAFGPEPARLQAELPDDITLLSYFLGDERSHLWLVTADDLQHVVLPPGGVIAGQVHALAGSLRSERQSRSRIRYQATQLRDAVLPVGIADWQGRQLVIVADGALQLVPFGLLPADNRSQDLLLDRNHVLYAPSAELFAILDRRPFAAAGSVAVLADPLADTNGHELALQKPAGVGAARLFARRALSQSAINLDRLPGAKVEAMSIRNVVQEEQASGSTIKRLLMRTGSEASLGFVEQGGLAGYDILHFATHGVVDADVPELSGLVLANDTGRGRPIAYLRPHMIARLGLDAELVVLSGCETGIGKSLAGEGLMSLSRSFFVAGARQLVASLWKVSDQATAQLMNHFYHHLLDDGHTAERSLRLAKQEMRNDPRWGHPYFWAGFVLQGGRTGALQQPVNDSEVENPRRKSPIGAMLMGYVRP